MENEKIESKIDKRDTLYMKAFIGILLAAVVSLSVYIFTGQAASVDKLAQVVSELKQEKKAEAIAQQYVIDRLKELEAGRKANEEKINRLEAKVERLEDSRR